MKEEQIDGLNVKRLLMIIKNKELQEMQIDK
jgi:hypothetical protein